MTTTLSTTAQNQSDAIAQVQALHPGCIVDAFTSNDGYDVLVWANESDSVNDDGAKAIARYAIARGA
jgi:hypothetical protein